MPIKPAGLGPTEGSHGEEGPVIKDGETLPLQSPAPLEQKNPTGILPGWARITLDISCVYLTGPGSLRCMSFLYVPVNIYSAFSGNVLTRYSTYPPSTRTTNAILISSSA